MAFKLCFGIKKDEWKNESIKSNIVVSFFKPSLLLQKNLRSTSISLWFNRKQTWKPTRLVATNVGL